LEVVYKVTDDP